MVTNVVEKNETIKQRQSESITFRLDSTILNKLHHEADQKDISVTLNDSKYAKVVIIA